MITLEKILTQLKADFVNEIVGGHKGHGGSSKKSSSSTTTTTSTTDDSSSR